ncbi:hypothetical protein BS78_07G129300 [Paspalum vaginatum]|nr:hypothetical protein BS78_07G129300 [Paspalum vaginatum]
MITDIGRAHGDQEDVDAWAEKTVGDPHLGKRKTKIGPEQRKGKRTKTCDDEDIGSEDTTPEASDGSGDDDSDGDGDGDGDGGSGDGNDGDSGGGGGGGQGLCLCLMDSG